MIILFLNWGVSLKYRCGYKTRRISPSWQRALWKRIGQDMGIVTHKKLIGDKEKYKVELPVPHHTVGIAGILNLLTDKKWGVLESLTQIQAVGHRVAQGGKYYKDSVMIDEEVKRNIRKLAGLAPLHNPAHLLGIEAVDKLLPHVNRLAVFDTPSTRPCRTMPICMPSLW